MTVLILILILIAALSGYLLIGAVRLKAEDSIPAGAFIDPSIDINKAAQNLKKAVQCRTVSNTDYEKVDWNEFTRFQAVLKESYPKTHQKFEQLEIDAKGLVYHWQGGDSSLKPILLLAHCDVVPVEDGTEKEWDYPPFNGEIADGYLYGRGSMDIKVQLISYFEAAEMLIAEGFVPKRDLYFAFGFDEEVGGKTGATKIAEHFESRGIEFDCVIDEGAVVMTGGLHPDLDGVPIATVGIAEKGLCNVLLTAKSPGGHSSTPPPRSSLGIVAEAITRLENHKMKSRLCQSVKISLTEMAKKMSLKNRLLFANMGLLSPVILKLFSKTPQLDALVRTTIAATMCSAANAANILPQVSTATINYRVLPGDTIEDVVNHVKTLTGDLEIEVSTQIATDPSKTSNTDSEAYQKLSASIKKMFPETTIVPILLSGGTDARKYEAVSNNIYRFIPNYMTNDDIKRLHGTNERISLKNIELTVSFFKQFIKDYDTSGQE